MQRKIEMEFWCGMSCMMWICVVFIGEWIKMIWPTARQDIARQENQTEHREEEGQSQADTI